MYPYIDWQPIETVEPPPEGQYCGAPILVGRIATESRPGAVGVGRAVRALLTKEIIVEPTSNNLRADWPITHWAPMPKPPGELNPFSARARFMAAERAETKSS